MKDGDIDEQVEALKAVAWWSSIVIALVLIAAVFDDANAASQVYRWVAPTDMTNVREYRLRTGRCGSSLNLGLRIVPRTSTSASMDIPEDGRVYCAQVVSFGYDQSESSPLELPMALFPSPATITATINAAPTEVAPGAPVTLTWRSTGAASCRGWDGLPRALEGTETVNAAASVAYGITCEASNGDFTAAVAAVTVRSPPAPPSSVP